MFQTIYLYRSSEQPRSSFYAPPGAFRQIGLAPKFLVIDFPLYFLPEAEDPALFRQALIDLRETPSAVAEPSANVALPK